MRMYGCWCRLPPGCASAEMHGISVLPTFLSPPRSPFLNFNIFQPVLPLLALWFLHLCLVSFSLLSYTLTCTQHALLVGLVLVVCTCELRTCQGLVKGNSHVLHINGPAVAIIAILRKATLTRSSSFIFSIQLFPFLFFHIMKSFHLFLLPTSHLFCKQISHTTLFSFLLSVILLLFFFYLSWSVSPNLSAYSSPSPSN